MTVNPFKTVLNIRRGEWRLSLLMAGYFFLVITSFWILKPLKKGLFIRYYDQSGLSLWFWHLKAAQAEQLAKVMNIAAALVAAFVFAWLARRFHRHQLTYIASLFFAACYLFFIQVVDQPAGWVVWSFYLFGDLFSTVMVGTFFAFLNDSVTPGQARRLYGLVGLGGVSGGAFGSLVVFSWIDDLDIKSWLWVTMAIAVIVVVLAHLVARSLPPRIEVLPPEAESTRKTATLSRTAMDGARLVLRSRYFMAIMALVGLYEIVSTIMDFQFTATIAHYLDNSAIDRQFAAIYVLTNAVALAVQLFLTAPIMSQFGLTTALMVLPVAILVASTGFLIVPALWVGSLLNTADGGFSYSINQSAKEALYVPARSEDKYQAKAFIDMFGQRLAKALAVAIGLIITAFFGDFETMRWLSLVTLTLLVLWTVAVRFAGRRFAELTQKQAKIWGQSGPFVRTDSHP